MRRGYRAAGFAVAAVVGLLLLAFFVLRGPGGTSGPASRGSTTASGFFSRFSTGLASSNSTGGPRITGVVRDAQGPVAGVRVSASRVEPEVTLSERSCPPSDSASLAPGEPPPRLMRCWDEAFDELVEQVDQREGEAPTVAETLSAEDGSFILDGLPEGKLTLQATHGQSVAMRPDVTTGREGVVLQLDEGLFFEGIVTNEPPGREPVVGARITVFSHEHTRFFPATSGADGRFRIGPVPPADYGILVTVRDRGPLLRMRADPLEEATFILDRPAKYAGTVVTAKGAPAPGVSVRLYTPGITPEWRTALTDARGHFSFRSVEGPPGQLFAETAAHDGFAYVETEPREDVVLTLGPGMIIQGTVSDESGSPIPGARVQAHRHDEGTPSQRGQAVTDAQGHYRLGPLFRLPHFMAARAARHVDVEPEYQELGEMEEAFDFTLPHAASVAGVLVDEAGQPLSGRTVQLHPGPVSPSELDVITDHAVTDEAGRFVLDAAEAGPAWLDVDDATFVLQRLAVELPSENVRMVLRRGTQVSLTVLSAVEAPVRSAQVTLWKRDARGEADRVEVTDAHGQATLQGVPPGSYVAEAMVPGRAVAVHASQPVEVRAGEAPSVTLRLEEGRTLRGAVVSPQGRPLPGVALRAEVLEADRPRYRGALSRPGLEPEGVRTDAEGHFTLRSLSAARHVLTAKLPGHVVVASASQGVLAGGDDDSVVVGRDTAEVRLVLRRIPHVRGRVVAEGGEALEFFEVNGQRYTHPDGRFDQRMFEATGAQRFLVRAKGFAQVDRTVTPDGENDLDLGTVTLTRGRTVRVLLREASTGAPYNGRMRDTTGREMTAALSYQVHGEGVSDGPPFLPPTRTGPLKDGSLLLEHMPLTAFTLEVNTQFHLPSRARVGAEEESITLSLDTGARVTGHIRDAQGQPLKARLTFTRSDGLTQHLNLGPGDFTFNGLPPGRYTVNVWVEDAVHETRFPARSVRIPPGGDVTLDFDALGTGATVTLRLPEDVDSAFLLPGQALAPGSARDFVHLGLQQHPLEEWTGTSVTFRRVPAGHYTVIASNRDKDRIHREELDVPAEGTLSRDVRPVWIPLAR
ncbi:carboxypeptidase regulatory-like domain-containing protein [Corallococcus exercitus]|uniref:carboxypeptidase regulatory-like domain-containing protein n=1 Tax=Corallococcus exercitus TaxID=2316736 RepID=UPI0035D44C19